MAQQKFQSDRYGPETTEIYAVACLHGAKDACIALARTRLDTLRKEFGPSEDGCHRASRLVEGVDPNSYACDLARLERRCSGPHDELDDVAIGQCETLIRAHSFEASGVFDRALSVNYALRFWRTLRSDAVCRRAMKHVRGFESDDPSEDTCFALCELLAEKDSTRGACDQFARAPITPDPVPAPAAGPRVAPKGRPPSGPSAQ